MARDFDQVAGEYLGIADEGPSDVLGPFTIYAWINPDINTGSQRIVAKFAAATGNRQWMMELNGNKLDGRSAGTTVQDSVTGATVVSTSTWHSCAYRRENSGGSGNHEVFLDGTQDATGTCTRTVQDRTADVRIATEADDTASAHFNGRICEVGIWTAYLSAAELSALWHGVSPMMIRPTELVGYWPIFGDASPEPDYTGGGNATVNGTPVRATNHAPVSRFST